jgi:D-alanyl-D-alanine dipeptidase
MLNKYFTNQTLRIAVGLAALSSIAIPNTSLLGVSAAQVVPAEMGAKPADISESWKPLIGSYVDSDNVTIEIFEDNGALQFKEGAKESVRLRRATGERFLIDGQPPVTVTFVSDSEGVKEIAAGAIHARRQKYGDIAKSFSITPLRPLEEIRKEALASEPPREEKVLRKPDLVELSRMDAAIHLEIRYATKNNFLGAPVYSQGRAFLQRPAALALVRALHALEPLGYGLLIHDGYRPWYVTKIFWEATPAEGRIFVADPAHGSRHNRGCAVDLTLYDLKSGAPVEMPGTYDEMSPRSFPNYPGGTSLQRWHRELLRHAMEAEGFTVYEAEWWHFDYKDWAEYPILNIPFEQMDLQASAALAN